MGLSRLDNFLKSSRGTILYVDPNSLDATDSIENQGNSLTRPFKTIQRALIESARFSYQRGLNNDRFGKTTILLYPGDHLIDNRPGYIPDGVNNFRLRDGTTSNNLPAFDLNSNFDLTSPDNELHKLNSIHGGVILPRGTSLVGLDLRKTKVRPKYVPNPENDDIERSAVFRVTGVCYIWQFTLFDSDPNGVCYKDYTNNTFVPNFSHHKLACFEYADGTNDVKIEDTFQTYSTDRTDLDMYYEKISLVYGQSSGREISPDYPSSGLDIQPKIDEFRIVGSTGQSIGITSIKAGNGIVATTNITVTTTSAVDGLDVDTPFRVSGITAAGYNGQFVVSEKTSSTQIVYQVQNAPISALPSVTGATLSLQSDTVTSASPYIFNISLRSVFGMCGLVADGSKASGFKSMVVAQFTAVGLQKDDNAFVKYNPTTGAYEDNSTAITPLSNDSRAVYKPSYKNFHIKATNNSVIQAVSVFAIGFAEHFVTENGGDQSITNSNSNFGAKSLVADGFRNESFAQDDLGYITHIIPPKEVPLTESSIEFSAIDVLQTVGIASTAHLYLYGEKNLSVPPENVIEGYRIGTRVNDTLKVLVASAGAATEYSSRIVMPGSQSSSEKSFNVNRSAAGINSIGAFSSGGTSNVLTFTQSHTLLEGESIRILSDNGHLPDGLTPNIVYFAITSGLTTTTNIKIAKTLNDALNGTPLNINANGGALKVVSRVSDKNSGDIGHPIQYDTTNSQWFIKVASASTENSIYSTIVGLGSTGLGDATTRTYFKRKSDNRSANDTLYRVRYVIPKTSASGINARPPVDGFILQESNTSIGSTTGEIETYFGTGSLGNVNQQRNFRIIANAEWTGAVANITTELPHNLIVGSQVELVNIKSTNNTIGASELGFNETYSVTGISSAKQFSVALTTNPGTFTNDTSARTTALPYFKRKRYETTYYVYRFSEGQKYISGEQDGIYYFTLANSSNKPTVTPFNEEKYSQPVKELFPQINRDNPTSDPAPTKCFAQSELIGEVVVNDVRSSITKETVNKLIRDTDVGVGIVNITSATGTAHTITTSIDHGLNKVTALTITNGGTGYGSGTAGDLYNARLVGIGASVTGLHASAKITVNSSGTITAIKIMDGGSAYGIGNTLAVVGVSTFAPFVQSVVTVSSIYNNVGDTLRVVGVQSEGYADYNDLYRITGVNVGGATSITVSSASTVSNSVSTGLGVTLTSGSYLYLTGEAIRINSLVYTASSGIATVVTANSHGLKVDQKVRFTGANQNQYLGSFVVTQIFDVLAATPSYSFSVNIGIGTTAPTATGTLFAFREGYTSNNGGITLSNENLNGRMIPSYAGITTTLAADIITAATDQISITGIANLDVNIGDYFMIDDEIVRVKTTTTGSNPVSVFRGILGTKPTIHFISSTIRKININPVELRRHSISRASGHTFEYVGFGPGNYSTALPDKHDRAISPGEELLSQSTRRDGGINFYTGMNDKGISYSGNRKINTTTGVEEIFDTPVQTITGDDIGVLNSINVINPLEGSFARSIRVEGGDNNTAISEFNGPVIVTSKFTSTSNKGIEANSLYLQGDAIVSRNYTVGISIPSLAGNPGDIAYYSDPNRGGYVGWIYTLENEWYRFGNISISETENHMIFDRVGIATTSAGTDTFRIGAGSSLFSVNASGGVGIGTTANQYKLNVNGNVNIGGTITASYFSGDGSFLVNLNAAALGWTQISGGIYNTALNNVGIGTSVPRFNLEVGSVGAGGTSLWVNNNARFDNFLSANNATITGIITASSYNFTGGTGTINAGIITTSTLIVGTGGTVITTNTTSVGIGTTVPRVNLDVEGTLRIKIVREAVESLSIASNIVTVDLSKAQNFLLSATADVNSFTIINPPSESNSFTIKIAQDATGGRVIDIDDFRTLGNVPIPVNWPGGGVLPIVTPTASRNDIYTFKTFDGGSNWYGIVVGQNFAN